mmetsp:Transcript_32824/g.94268  ORF Transcript_32824/g.94268 Transcript_32824/m.94268 type:complete len:207 (+) Transcript_32824:330-950(+)
MAVCAGLPECAEDGAPKQPLGGLPWCKAREEQEGHTCGAFAQRSWCGLRGPWRRQQRPAHGGAPGRVPGAIPRGGADGGCRYLRYQGRASRSCPGRPGVVGRLRATSRCTLWGCGARISQRCQGCTATQVCSCADPQDGALTSKRVAPLWCAAGGFASFTKRLQGSRNSNERIPLAATNLDPDSDRGRQRPRSLGGSRRFSSGRSR